MPSTAKIDSTVNLLKGDVTAADGSKGVDAIKKWETDLEHAEWRGAKTIHADLVKLRNHLENGDADGPALGGLLVKLGEATGRAAAHAEGAQRSHLEGLGQALVSAGEGLGGSRGS